MWSMRERRDGISEYIPWDAEKDAKYNVVSVGFPVQDLGISILIPDFPLRY